MNGFELENIPTFACLKNRITNVPIFDTLFMSTLHIYSRQLFSKLDLIRNIDSAMCSADVQTFWMSLFFLNLVYDGDRDNVMKSYCLTSRTEKQLIKVIYIYIHLYSFLDVVYR